MRASDEQIWKAHQEAGVEQELSRWDTDIQDATDGIIFDLFRDLTGDEPEWDIELIGDLRDYIIEAVARRSGRTEYSFHPYMVHFEDKQPTTFQDVQDILENQLRNEPHALAEFQSLIEIIETSEDHETEEDALRHLIDVAWNERGNWSTLLMALGEPV
jgi:hypothetical protein